MPYEAYKIYEEYESEKYKTSTQEKVAKALAGAEKAGIKPAQEVLDFSEAKEIFGKDFLGPEAIEKTFGINLSYEELKQVEQIPFTLEDLEQAKKLGMMLVLRVSHDKENKPLTINQIRIIFAGEDKLGDPSKKKSKLIFSQHGDSSCWYKDEVFANSAVANFGWGLVKKEVLPESLGKNWDDQEEVIKKWAEANNINRKTIHRRTPIEVAYDTLLYYGANRETLLEKTYDWTSAGSSAGDLVYVGYFDADGLCVDHDTRDSRYTNLGVCPSR